MEIQKLPSYQTIKNLCKASQEAISKGFRKVDIGEISQAGDLVFNGLQFVQTEESQVCTNPGKIFFTKRSKLTIYK